MISRIRNSMIAAAAAAVVCLGTAAAPAHAEKGREIAVQDPSSFVGEVPLRRSPALTLAQKLFVTRTRVTLPWATIVNNPSGVAHKQRRPKPRHFDFSSYDALLNAA